MPSGALSVHELNEYVRKSLAGDPLLRFVTIKGELSNFKPYASGHWYFTLKDDLSRIACVMFRQSAQQVDFQPADGQQVLLTGQVSLYVQNGSYQFYADFMRKEGQGPLYERFLQLKEKLTKEGLFDSSLKRPLPLLPRAIGVATSVSGAVWHDIMTVSQRRFPGIPLVLRPCRVQGDDAAPDLINALNELSALPQVDVIIIGRGGGSLEDLWAFNDETLARAVRACPVPVVSAVGHETDTSLCDLAADVRAATPSMAAELSVPLRQQLLDSLFDYTAAMARLVAAHLDRAEANLERLRRRLEAHRPDRLLAEQEARLKALSVRLSQVIDNALTERTQDVQLLQARLTALSPMGTLRRGYAMAMAGDRPVTSAQSLPDRFRLVFHDGDRLAQTIDEDEEQ